MTTTNPVTLFYSYSHADEDLRVLLDKHLQILKRLNVIQDWHDRNIEAGVNWTKEIDAQINQSQVILLLISADFLASDYCYDVEMKRALERHQEGSARVIPIILRPVDWKNAPFAQLQALPSDAKPVTTWPNLDLAFQNVTQGIRRVVESLFKQAP